MAVVIPWEDRESLLDERGLYIDERYEFGRRCIYCPAELTNVSREHTPSKSFLDKPYAPRLPTVPDCPECNKGFDKDDEFAAVLVECWRCNTARPESVERETVARALSRSTGLRVTMERLIGATDLRENPRLLNILRKLVLGHAYFELGRRPVSAEIDCFELSSLSAIELDAWEDPPGENIMPEIGSRLFVDSATFMGEALWFEPQEERYRYMVRDGEPCEVRIILSEFLGVQAYVRLEEE